MKRRASTRNFGTLALWLLIISILFNLLLHRKRDLHINHLSNKLLLESLNSRLDAQQLRPEFGFIMTRCVRAPVHNELWRENYRCLRRYFPSAPIVIIDDYSDMTLVDRNFSTTNALIVESTLPPGKGEILPYYYFYHYRPFVKAVMLNDGMLLQKREPLATAIRKTNDYRFLWSFSEFQANESEEQLFLISFLKPHVQGRLKVLQSQFSNWVGCFSTASIMTWEFLDRIHKEYGVLDLVPAIRGRADRMGLERVVALITIDATEHGMRPAQELSVFGSVLAHPKTGAYTWADYVADRNEGRITESMIKIWNGR